MEVSAEPASRSQPGARRFDGRAIAIVLSCMVGMALTIPGVYLTNFSIFVKPIAQDFSWSRTQVSLNLSLTVLTLALCAPLAGRLGDRIGTPRVLLLGAVPFGAALAVLGLLPGSLPAFAAASIAIGAFGAMTYIPLYLNILSRRFDRRLGAALGLASMGVGIGTALSVNLVQAAVTAQGWHMALVLLGVVVGLLTLFNALLLSWIAPPPAAQVRTGAIATEGLTVAEAVRNTRLWRAAISYMLMVAVGSGSAANLVPLLTDHGIAPAAAASVVGAAGLSMMVGRVLNGFLMDRIDAGLLGSTTFFLAAIGAFLLIDVASVPTAVIGIVLLGFAVGAEGDLLGYVTKRLAGLRAYTSIVGLMHSVFLAGTLSGPLLMALSFDRLGGYRPVQIAFVAMALAAGVLHLGILPRARRPAH